MEPGVTVRGASIAFSESVFGTFTRARDRQRTRELSLDETLGVLGDRATQRIVALQPPTPVASNVTGSHKRTRRMRAQRFKALSLAELNRPIERDTVPYLPVALPRDGIATVKIDRVRIQRQRRLRRALMALACALFVIWLLT